MPAEGKVTVQTTDSVIDSAGGRLSPGCLVDGKFEILGLLGLLGMGGMSVVYKARHVTLDRVVALKVLQGHVMAKQISIQRFQREAATASALQHKNIIEVLAFGIFDDQPFMALEFLEGESLSDLLKNQGRFAVERAVPIFAQICDALNHAHEHGVVHRDLKPSNVMLIGSGESVKLVDFGIAKVLHESGAQQQKLTQTGQVFGSPFYMSPEQCQGNVIDARSDIYSMGCLMYEVLTGQPPFVGNTVLETMSKHLGEEPSDIDLVSQDLNKVLRRALAKDPSARFQTISEVKSALAVADYTVQPTGTKKIRQELLGKRFSRRFWAPAILFLAVICLGFFGVLSLQKVDDGKVALHNGSIAEARSTRRILSSALANHQTDPVKSANELLYASRLAAERQEPHFRITAISALATLYDGKAGWLEVEGKTKNASIIHRDLLNEFSSFALVYDDNKAKQLAIEAKTKNAGAMNRQLAEARKLLQESPNFTQQRGYGNTIEVASCVAGLAQRSGQSAKDQEFFLQHAYDLLVADKRNTSGSSFDRTVIKVGTAYAAILRNNGNSKMSMDVETVVKHSQKQQQILEERQQTSSGDSFR